MPRIFYNLRMAKNFLMIVIFHYASSVGFVQIRDFKKCFKALFKMIVDFHINTVCALVTI